MDVSIVIVNYNTIGLVIDCIESVLRQTKDIEYEIIVIDNASRDGSVQTLRDRYPRLSVIANDQNVGFGRANNIGIAQAQGKYVFLLNSDTILLNNAPKIFYDFMESHADRRIGAIGAVMLDDRRTPNHSNSYNKFFSLCSFICHTFRSLVRYKASYIAADRQLEMTGSMAVDFIVGADMFCPKEILDRVGGFDPRYFMYYEEVDMQLSLRKLGFERLIISGPQIIHLEGGSTSKQMSSSKWDIYTRSMFLYFRKNRPRAELIAIKSYYITVAVLGGLLKIYKVNFRDKIEYIRTIIRN